MQYHLAELTRRQAAMASSPSRAAGSSGPGRRPPPLSPPPNGISARTPPRHRCPRQLLRALSWNTPHASSATPPRALSPPRRRNPPVGRGQSAASGRIPSRHPHRQEQLPREPSPSGTSRHQPRHPRRLSPPQPPHEVARRPPSLARRRLAFPAESSSIGSVSSCTEGGHLRRAYRHPQPRKVPK